MHSAEDMESCEPNLIPLLDLVLQLLMLFIVCANFIQQEGGGDLELPDSQSARPVEKGSVDVLFINMNHEGKVVVLDREPMTMADTSFWLRDQFEAAKQAAKGGKIETAVIIRASKHVDYAQVFLLMQECRNKGFRNLNVRAVSLGSDPS
jgi:biopolymer transport protein ExbD